VLSFPKQLLDTILPTEARAILINSIKAAGEAKETVDFLQNVEAEMIRYAENGLLNRNAFSPFQFESKCLEFETHIRKVLKDIGNRVDLNGFDPVPLEDASIHRDLAQACELVGITPKHGYCPVVYIDTFGRATAQQAHIFRLSVKGMYVDIQEGDNAFHVIRFIAPSRRIPTIQKIRFFSMMVKLLLRTSKRVTGKSGSANDGCILMDESGDWRFLKEQSPFGPISRLERFWLRVGALPERLFVPESPLLVFFREEDALEVVRECQRLRPDSVTPYALLSRFSLYPRETVAKLRF